MKKKLSEDEIRIIRNRYAIYGPDLDTPAILAKIFGTTVYMIKKLLKNDV
jgi:hypothetical protein